MANYSGLDFAAPQGVRHRGVGDGPGLLIIAYWNYKPSPVIPKR